MRQLYLFWAQDDSISDHFAAAANDIELAWSRVPIRDSEGRRFSNINFGSDGLPPYLLQAMERLRPRMQPPYPNCVRIVRRASGVARIDRLTVSAVALSPDGPQNEQNAWAQRMATIFTDELRANTMNRGSQLHSFLCDTTLLNLAIPALAAGCYVGLVPGDRFSGGVGFKPYDPAVDAPIESLLTGEFCSAQSRDISPTIFNDIPDSENPNRPGGAGLNPWIVAGLAVAGIAGVAVVGAQVSSIIRASKSR